MKYLTAAYELLRIWLLILLTLFGAALFLAAVDQKSHEPVHVRGQT